MKIEINQIVLDDVKYKVTPTKTPCKGCAFKEPNCPMVNNTRVCVLLGSITGNTDFVFKKSPCEVV